jgi:competence protein ComGF
LTLPAASIHRTRVPVRAASTSVFSLYSTLVTILIVVALALVATTVLIARHRRAAGN